MKLQNRTALITGAAQGIGLAIAYAFVKQGGRVVLADIDADRVAAEAANIGTDNDSRAYNDGADTRDADNTNDTTGSSRARANRGRQRDHA